MSTHRHIKQCVAKGYLIPWEAGFIGAPSRRCLFVTPEIMDELDPATWSDSKLGTRYGQLVADFDRFAEGQNVPVAMSPYDKARNAFLARIDPVQYGIWNLRSIDPSPAMRVFGVFFAVDHFVALAILLRAELDGPGGTKWAKARENALARWNEITDYYPLILGDKIEDYISEKTISV